MRTWTRALVIVIALMTATLGLWAGFAPESFYQHGPLPFVDTGWVAGLPPYNEHLVRDYGFMNLGMTVVLVVAAIRLTPALVRAGTAALFVFAVPHMVFHSFHLDHLSAAGAATQMISVSVLTVVLPAVVFLMAGGLKHEHRGRPRPRTYLEPYSNEDRWASHRGPPPVTPPGGPRPRSRQR